MICQFLRFIMTTEAHLSEYFDFIFNLTKEAGKIVLEGFHGVKEVSAKDGHSWDVVTDYDNRVEHLLTSEIKKKYPNHLFIAEEETSRTKVKPHLTDAPTWIIDPIDGTNNFIHGLPLSAISIALAVDKQLVLGIVYNPMMDQMYTAVKGKGAFCNGQPIHSSKVQKLDDAVVTTEPSLARVDFIRERTQLRFGAIAPAAQGVRSFGCAALTLCYIANGSTDAFYTDGLQCWDVAAGVLILQEAGGHVCHSDGTEFSIFTRNILSTGTKSLAEELTKLLRAADEKSKTKMQVLT